MLISLIAILILVGLDQYSKFLAEGLMGQPSVILIKGVLSLTYVENRGAAYGMLQGGRLILIPLTIIILIVVTVYYFKLPKQKPYNWVRVALTLIFAGAIGNLIDRVFRGYVIDFFHATFIDFPVFNVADCCVVVGAILLGFLMIFVVKENDNELNN